MKKLSFDNGSFLAPLPPVMVSCGDMDNSNIITIAWTGIINSSPSKTYISVRPSRHSYDIIKNTKEFVINLTTESLVKSADWCGVISGAKEDKFKKCSLTKGECKVVSAPLIVESPINIECRVSDIISLGTHDMFIADIVNVNVDENLMDEKGKLHFEKASLVSYIHGTYFKVGRRLANMGFSVRKQKNRNKK